MNPTENTESLAAALQAVLDGAHAPIRRKTRDFLSQPGLAPVPPGTTVADHRDRTLASLRASIDAGFSSLPFAKDYGGRDSVEDYLNFFETISHQDGSFAIKVGVQYGLFGMGLQSLGTQKHHAAYIPDVISGKLLGGFAMTEFAGKGRGSDTQEVETNAIYDHARRSFVLNTPHDGARKAYIGNAAQDGRMMIVFAQLKMTPDGESQGVHAFLVPIRDAAGKTMAGVAIEDCGEKVGLNGVDNGILSFDHVELPYDALLDRFASIDADGVYQNHGIDKKSKRFFKMASTLVPGRVGVAMSAGADAKNALAAIVDYTAHRAIDDETLLDKPTTQSVLFPHLAKAYAAHFATHALVDEIRSGTRDLETRAAAIKAEATDEAYEAIDKVSLLAGGRGYMSAEPYERLRNDADVKRRFEGANERLRCLTAGNRMGELAQQFNASAAGKIIGPAKHYAAGISARFNASFMHQDFLDPEFQVRIFARREQAMLHTLAAKFHRLEKSLSKAKAADACGPDMQKYARAFAQHYEMKVSAARVAEQTDPQLKAALKDMCDLFAVSMVQENAGWYLENGYLSPQATRSLPQVEEALYKKIRPNIDPLIKAFAIPPALLPLAELAPAILPPRHIGMPS